jgi:acyl-CoA synthetase (AMP-forming)/AMP-acid ligase II
MQRALQALPKVRFLITFGQTEASFPVTLHEVEDKDVSPKTNPRPFVPLGKLTPPYRASKIGPKTGELRLCGAAVAAAQWRPKDAKQGRFLRLKRWHATGDLVKEDSAGILHYLGRRGSLKHVRRGCPAPEAVEALIREHLGVKRARVDRMRPSRDGVRADVTIEPLEGAIDPGALRDLFNRRRAEASLPNVSLGVLRSGEVPLTMSGKVKRPAKRRPVRRNV